MAFHAHMKSVLGGHRHPHKKSGLTHRRQKKVSKVMHEFGSGVLKTHGKKVTNHKQSVAIALSEARRYVKN